MMFAQRLKELRTAKNLSQMQLAKQTGIIQSAIAKWELNQREPTSYAIIILAKFFGETTDFLLGVTE